jgi:hypothetical protein
MMADFRNIPKPRKKSPFHMKERVVRGKNVTRIYFNGNDRETTFNGTVTMPTRQFDKEVSRMNRKMDMLMADKVR